MKTTAMEMAIMAMIDVGNFLSLFLSVQIHPTKYGLGVV